MRGAVEVVSRAVEISGEEYLGRTRSNRFTTVAGHAVGISQRERMHPVTIGEVMGEIRREDMSIEVVEVPRDRTRLIRDSDKHSSRRGLLTRERRQTQRIVRAEHVDRVLGRCRPKGSDQLREDVEEELRLRELSP